MFTKNFRLQKPFLIAEIGINHNGSLQLAKKLIDLAKKYGFDAVKFQKRNPDVSTPEYLKETIRSTPWGEITYLKYKKKIEFGYKEFKEIDKYCKKKKIIWFASAWDIESQKFLKKFNLRYNKVASAMLTNFKLIEEIAKEKKKTLISTGLATLKDVEKCVKIFKKAKCKFVLMHCVSAYPCPPEKLNLNSIISLKKKFKCEVGYSGHETSVSPTILAYYLGAKYIERHITLDRSMYGSDQSASIEPNGLKSLVDSVRKIETALGNGKKVFLKEEKIMAKKLRSHLQ